MAGDCAGIRSRTPTAATHAVQAGPFACSSGACTVSAMTRTTVAFQGKRVLTIETAQRGETWSWAVFNVLSERLGTGEGSPDEPAALKAARTFARQLLYELIDGLRPVPS